MCLIVHSLLPKIVSRALRFSSASEASRELGNENPLDCADTSIIRTPSLRELLYTRSNIVVTAKAFGLEAIDMAS